MTTNSCTCPLEPVSLNKASPRSMGIWVFFFVVYFVCCCCCFYCCFRFGQNVVYRAKRVLLPRYTQRPDFAISKLISLYVVIIKVLNIVSVVDDTDSSFKCCSHYITVHVVYFFALFATAICDVQCILCLKLKYVLFTAYI